MISIKHVSKQYRQKNEVVYGINDVTLDINSSGLIGIQGHSGSGKTTLLNLIYGFDSVYEGEIVHDIKPNEMYYITQKNVLLKNKRVIDQFKVAMDEYNEDKVKEALLKVSLDESYLYKETKYLSTGEEKRLMIALALIKEVKLLLADEPTENLDEYNQSIMMSLLKSLSQTITVIVVSHNEKLLKAYADRIINFDRGNIISDYANPTNIKPISLNSQVIEKIIPRTISKYASLRHSLNYVLIASFLITLTLLLSITTRLIIKDEASFLQFDEHTYVIETMDENIENAISNEIVFPIYQQLFSLRGMFLSEIEQYAYLNPVQNQQISFVDSLAIKHPYLYGKAPSKYNEVSLSKKSAKLMLEANKLPISVSMKDLIGKRLELSINNLAYTFYVSGIYDSQALDIAIQHDFYVFTTPYYNISYAVMTYLIPNLRTLAQDEVLVSNQSGYNIHDTIEILGKTYTVLDTYDDPNSIERIVFSDRELNLINYIMHKEANNRFIVLDSDLITNKDQRTYELSYAEYISSRAVSFIILIVLLVILTAGLYFIIILTTTYELTYYESDVLFYKLNHYSNQQIVRIFITKYIKGIVGTTLITTIVLGLILSTSSNSYLFKSNVFSLIVGILGLSLVLVVYYVIIISKANKGILKMYKEE
jgi:putative ABC transport system ATP-binding protein